jgi:hypothetical protein
LRIWPKIVVYDNWWRDRPIGTGMVGHLSTDQQGRSGNRRRPEYSENTDHGTTHFIPPPSRAATARRSNPMPRIGEEAKIPEPKLPQILRRGEQ